jgi:hypothetical protein
MRAEECSPSPPGLGTSLPLGRLFSPVPAFGAYWLVRAGSITTIAGNITNLQITNRSLDFFEILVDIEVQDLRHLTNIIAALRAKPSRDAGTGPPRAAAECRGFDGRA